MTTTAAEPASASRRALSRTGQALQGRDFRLWFHGRLTSASGALAQGVATSWTVLELTHDAVWLTVRTACARGPTLLLGPWAGALVDRADRRRLLLVTQSLTAAVSLTLAQLRSAPEMRGRVMSLWGSAMTGTLPFTGLVVTAVSQHVDARLGFSLSGTALLLATLAAWRALRPNTRPAPDPRRTAGCPPAPECRERRPGSDPGTEERRSAPRGAPP